MFKFLNDYSESAHPDIISALQNMHLQQYDGYGFDKLSEQVRDDLRSRLGNQLANKARNEEIAIHFSITGTQANLVCIAAMLSAIDGIIACETGHIASNEAGAIEATGHKIILAPAEQGKLTVAAVDALRLQYSFAPHKVRPKAIYISNSSELGTVYSLAELQALSEYCRSHGMYVFLDGARLGAALAYTHSNAQVQTMSLKDIAELVDIFWLGGTKMGALFGEVIIIPNQNLAKDFNIYLKQHGSLLAKGYLLALQFAVLLKDDKYLELCQHANAMAQKLAKGILDCNYELSVPTQTNQVFALLPQTIIRALKTEFDFYEWQVHDDGRSTVRLVTSWATPEQEIERFLQLLLDVSSVEQ